MSDEVLKLGYDAALKKFANQDQYLGNIRTRATGLLSAATVATAFAASIGLLGSDPQKGGVIPVRLAEAMIGLFILIGIANALILAPVRKWNYGFKLAGYLPGETGQPVDQAKFLRGAIENALVGVKKNDSAIAWRVWTFQVAILLVVAELIVTIAVVINLRG